MNWKRKATENTWPSLVNESQRLNNSRVALQTEFGKIILELHQEKAPATVTNFLRYVDENRFTGACFYRVVRMDNQPNNEVKTEVIQGGLKEDEHPQSLPA